MVQVFGQPCRLSTAYIYRTLTDRYLQWYFCFVFIFDLFFLFSFSWSRLWSHYLDIKTANIIGFSIVHSILDYCNSLLHNHSVSETYSKTFETSRLLCCQNPWTLRSFLYTGSKLQVNEWSRSGQLSYLTNEFSFNPLHEHWESSIKQHYSITVKYSMSHRRSQRVYRALGARAPPRAEKIWGGGNLQENYKCTSRQRMHPRGRARVHFFKEIGEIWPGEVI